MRRDVGPRQAVAIGGSRGAFDVVQLIVEHLPEDYALAVMLVLHQHRHGREGLARVLRPRSRLQVVAVQDKEPIQAGRIYVCPANYHLLVERDRSFTLSTDAPVHFARPSIDVLFESAARTYGRDLMAVLLSGASPDGAAGLRTVADCGGAVACQDPATAVDPVMPRAGCAAVKVDWIGSPEALAVGLARLSPGTLPP
jgi:two-component system chemotaxis response regulator CheB